MEDEFNQFTGKVSDFINQEIRHFKQWHTSLEGETQQMQSAEAQVREVAQAMIERVDKVEYFVESTLLCQKAETVMTMG